MVAILIIEDEVSAMEFCQKEIRKILPDCEIYTAGAGREALNIVMQTELDAIFIDIELPDMTGMILAEHIRNRPEHSVTPIVFVTGKDYETVSLYKRYHLYEYIKKPFTSEEFQRAVGRMLKNLKGQRKRTQEPTAEKEIRYILLEGKDFSKLVIVEDILYAEVQKVWLSVVTRQGMISDVKMPLKTLINQMDTPFFVQCHKSYAIHVPHVTGIYKNRRRLWQARFCTEEATQCLIGNTYYQKIMELLCEAKQLERRS